MALTVTYKVIRRIAIGGGALGIACSWVQFAHCQAPSTLTQMTSLPESSRSDAYIAAFQETLRKPADPERLARFASIAVQAGDLEGAISALERLLLIDRDLADVNLELGVLYFRLGSFDTARGYLDRASGSPSASAETKTSASQYLAEMPSRAPHQASGRR